MWPKKKKRSRPNLQSKKPLRHQAAHITKTEFVSDVPPHGLNDKKMVEMAAFEEHRLLTRELGHTEDYP
jgi:hypothetical protein